MATPINTRILLRNDTLANWGTSTLTLGKGEVAIATINDTLAEVRVGTGSSTWATARKLNIGTDQVSGLTEMISALVGDGAKKYQVVANEENGNSWKLQEAALSGGDWSDVDGSTWTVDFTAINNAITGLTADVGYLSGQIDATNATLNTVSTDYLKSSVFNTLSNEIGLSAATASNQVVTKKDIADLAGAMHFRGAVTPQEGETDLEALARAITDPASGDVAIITTTSREYVYDGSNWIELGDEILYATKAEVAGISAELTGDIAKLTANDEYLSGEITSITSNYTTKTELNNVSVALSTDYVGKINALSGTYATKTEVSEVSSTLSNAITAITGNYATKEYVNGISSDLSTDYVAKIKEVNDKLTADYALSADVTSLVNETSAAVIGTTADISSANTVYGAKKYAEQYADATSAYALEQATDYADTLSTALSNTVSTDYIRHHEVTESDLSGFFVLDCGTATKRTGEPEAPFNV